MKNLLCLLFFITLFGCTDDDNDTTVPTPDGITTISGSVSLPAGSALDVNTLTVQSFTDFKPVVDSKYNIDVASEEINTLFVVDNLERVALMGFNYPTQTDFTINTSSTVLAMVMNLPITQNLSQQGRIDFVNAVKSSTEFESTVALLDAILAQGLSPFDTSQEEFISAIISLFNIAATTNRDALFNDDPVNVIRANREFIFQNPGKSYTSFIGIYKGEQRLEYIELNRVNFVPTSIGEALVSLIDGITGDVDIEEAPFTLPNDIGDYEIIIRTGKSFPDGTDEAADALKTNLANVAMDVFFGVLPFKKGTNRECFKQVASNFKTFVEANATINGINSPQDMLNKSYDLLKNFIQFYTTSFDAGNLPYLCATNDVTAFQKFLKSAEEKLAWLKLVGIFGNLGNLGLGTYQWGTDDAAIDLCFTVDETSVVECEPNLTLSGNLQFGEVTINTPKESILLLTNTTEQDIEISAIDLPEGFTVDWSSGTLTSGSELEVTVTFQPNALQVFGGTITVNNDFNQATNTIEANGTGVAAFTLEGDLNFGDVPINTSAQRTLTITNNMAEALEVSGIGLPNGYVSNWSSGTINTNTSQDVLINLIPNAVQAYNGLVTINNPIDPVNNTIPITGNGTQEAGEIFLSGDLNFGNIPINTTATATLSISNESTFPVNVSSISLPNGFTSDWNGGQIEGGFVTDVTITFAPIQEGDYSGVITVNNDTDQVNNTITVSGNGVSSPTSTRLFAYTTEPIMLKEIDLNNGNIINELGPYPEYLSDFVYLESTNEFICSNYDTYKINVNTGVVSPFSEASYEYYMVSNTQNRLFAYDSYYGRLIELDINTGNVIAEIIDLSAYNYSRFVLMEDTNEIVCHNFNGTFKINIDNGSISQINSSYYQDYIYDNQRNKLYVSPLYDTVGQRIVEIDLNTGNEIAEIINFGTTYYNNFVFSEDSNEIICRNTDNQINYKINVNTGEIVEFNNTLLNQEFFIIIN